MIPKDTDGDNKILKYKRIIRKSAINILAWLENNPSPSEEDIGMLKALQSKLKESIFYYGEHIKDWEKHTTTIELPQPVLEQKEFIEQNQIDISKE
tara:strand:+ start:13 stop:300 length:288 start_codon:yes stop_codon:yes gene_type:complete